jgi:pimeloyl-ACP methyl ester carboxylesterase
MIERVLQLREDRGLLGIVTPASTPKPADFACVLMNAGVIHRIGPHRLNVKLARHLADRGIASLRLDLSGVGDSRPQAGSQGFAQQAVVDIRKGIDAMQSLLGLRRFVVIGLCSGAAVGYRAALGDNRIAGLQMLDPYAYQTRTARLRYYLGRLRLPEAWVGWTRNLLGPAPPEEAANALLSDFVAEPPAAEFAAGLRTLVDRGTAVMCVYTGSLLKEYNYRDQFDEVMQRHGVAGRVRVEHMPDSTHTFLDLASQRQLIAFTDDWIQDTFHYPRRRSVLDSIAA